MAQLPSLTPGKKGFDAHAELTQAHDEAERQCALLHKRLSQVFHLDMANTQRQTIQIGSALQRVAHAERACGACYGRNHTFSKPYEQMLDHHRLAFVDFERLSRELETNLSPRCGDIAALAADIQHHLNLAEQAHQTSIGANLKITR